MAKKKTAKPVAAEAETVEAETVEAETVEAAKPKTKKTAKPEPKPDPEAEMEEVEPEPEADDTKTRLLALGAEMNAVLFPDEPVDFDGMDEEEIQAQIETDMEQIDPSDPFTDEAKATLEELGLEIEWKAPGKPAKPAKKAGDAKKTKPKADGPRYTRAQAFADVVLGGETSPKAIIEKSCQLFADNGGKYNLKEASDEYKKSARLLVAMGYATANDLDFIPTVTKNVEPEKAKKGPGKK